MIISQYDDDAATLLDNWSWDEAVAMFPTISLFEAEINGSGEAFLGLLDTVPWPSRQIEDRARHIIGSLSPREIYRCQLTCRLYLQLMK